VATLSWNQWQSWSGIHTNAYIIEEALENWLKRAEKNVKKHISEFKDDEL
jgi:hypothetical protein